MDFKKLDSHHQILSVNKWISKSLIKWLPSANKNNNVLLLYPSNVIYNEHIKHFNTLSAD